MEEEEIIVNDIPVPVWKRYLLTIPEASRFYHIGERNLRSFINTHQSEIFILQIGNKTLIKKDLFEEFIKSSTTI